MTNRLLSIVIIFFLATIPLISQPNYQFTSGTTPFISLASGNSFIWNTTIANNEEYTNPTPIGFNFNYCGNTFTELQVSSNGFLRLGNGLTSANPSDALNGTLRNVIAPLWDSTLTQVSTALDVTYQLAGTSPNQVLTVEWKNTNWTTANIEFQVKLYETSNKIEFIYGAMNAPTLSASASIGLSDGTSITTAGSATGKFLSINIAGTPGNRKFHQTMNLPFNFINNAVDNNTIFTFTQVTPSPLSGTYTIGGVSPDFISLSDAAAALNINGINGSVILNVREGIYDDIFHLIDVQGSSATNTITLKKESGDVTLTPFNGSYSSKTGSFNSIDAIIRLEGTQYLTIDGLKLVDNASADTIKKFEVGVCLGNTVLNGTMIKGGRFNNFINMFVDMKSSSANHAGSIGFRYFTSSSTETDTTKTTSNNKIENCYITGFWRAGWKAFGISSSNPDRNNSIINSIIGDININAGTTAATYPIDMDNQSGIQIINNTIRNVDNSVNTSNHVYAIYLNASSSLSNSVINIRNNNIFNIRNSGSTTTNGYCNGIIFNNTTVSTKANIELNKIYNLFSNGNASTRAIGIIFSGSSTSNLTINILNNFLYDFNAPRGTTSNLVYTSPLVRAFDLQNASNSDFKIYNNTVYFDDHIPVIGAHNGATILYCIGMNNNQLVLRNNIFVNSKISKGTGKTSIYQSYNHLTYGAFNNANNNIYYVNFNDDSSGISYNSKKLFKTLADHRTALDTVGGIRDLNTIIADASDAFVSKVAPYDLHIKETSWIPNGQAVPDSSIAIDVDGDIRSMNLFNGPSDIGADEYTPTGIATTVETGTIADGSTTIYTGVDNKTVVAITWHQNTGTLPTAVTVSYTPGKLAQNTINPSIFRSYTIDGIGGTAGWTADVKFYYNASTELINYKEASMRVNGYTGLGKAWDLFTTTIDTLNHYGQATINGFTTFSFDDGTNPLPVELNSFLASVAGNAINLNWKTSTETNSFKFEVERKEGSNWTKIGEVRAANNSTSPKEYSYSDKNLSAGRYEYRLRMVDLDGTFTYSNIVEGSITVPNRFELSQNYPNPFNPSTTINYNLPVDSKVMLAVYSITGEKVAELVNDFQTAGAHTIVFDASSLANGTYIYRLTAGSFTQTKKLILIK